MINIMEVTETNKMVEKENLDVRTITMGINLLDCAGPDLAEVNEKIYNKITTLAKDLVYWEKTLYNLAILLLIREYQLHLFLLLVLLHVRHLRIMLLLRKLLIKRLILLVLISLVVIQQLYQKV